MRITESELRRVVRKLIHEQAYGEPAGPYEQDEPGPGGNGSFQGGFGGPGRPPNFQYVDEDIADGTFLVDYISNSTFERVKQKFPGHKTNRDKYGVLEWHFEANDGSVFTVYARDGEPRVGSNSDDPGVIRGFISWLKSL